MMSADHKSDESALADIAIRALEQGRYCDAESITRALAEIARAKTDDVIEPIGFVFQGNEGDEE